MSRKNKKKKKNKMIGAAGKQEKHILNRFGLLLVVALAAVVVVVVLLVLGGGDDQPDQVSFTEDATESALEAGDAANDMAAANPEAVIQVEEGGIIRIELDPQVAPNTVNNFIYLAEQGFYDGLIFHRVIDDFMIQGGCPQGTGTGGPGYSIKGEFTANEFKNPLSHERGVISMARSNPFDSAGSQFFITAEPSLFLDGQYAAFGLVIEGMEVVDRIANVERDPANDRPLQDQRIKTITIETFGVEYEPPEKM